MKEENNVGRRKKMIIVIENGLKGGKLMKGKRTFIGGRKWEGSDLQEEEREGEGKERK